MTSPVATTRGAAISRLDAYHEAAKACREWWGRDEKAREELARKLDAARIALDEACRADWVG